MEDCLFCKIVAGKIPSKKVFENEYCFAFYDINPQAPVHILVVSKVHTPNIIDAVENYSSSLLECMKAIREIVEQEHLDEKGFRIVTNCGRDGCQSIDHLHFHILGGAQLSDKMS